MLCRLKFVFMVLWLVSFAEASHVIADGSSDPTAGKGAHAGHKDAPVLGPSAPPPAVSTVKTEVTTTVVTVSTPATANPPCPSPPAVGSPDLPVKPEAYGKADFFAQQLYDKLDASEAYAVWFRSHGLWLNAGKNLGEDAFTKDWVLKLKLAQAPKGKWMVVSDHNPKASKKYQYRYEERTFDLRQVRVLYYCDTPVVVAKCGNPMGPYTENADKPPSGLDVIPSSASGKEETKETWRPQVERKKKKRTVKTESEDECIEISEDDPRLGR